MDTELTIESKALKYVKNKNLCFVIKLISRSVECEWNGTRTQARSLKVKIYYEDEIEKENYDVFEFEDVKIFVSKELKIKGNISIYRKLKLPFMQPIFGVKGVDLY